MRKYILLITLFSTLSTLRAELKLPAYLGDNMVLQQGKILKIWGWANHGEKIRVKFKGKTKSTRADNQGRWWINLFPMKASDQPEEMTIRGLHDKVTIKNILIGEVWVCAGGRSMELPLDKASFQDDQKEWKNKQYPKIRLFQVKNNVSVEPLEDCEGAWKECLPENAAKFSAIAYYFATRINKDMNVPVGVMEASYRDAPIEAWIEAKAIAADELVEEYVFDKRKIYNSPDNQKLLEKKRIEGLREKFLEKYPVLEDKDWDKPTFNDSKWSEMRIPQRWEDAGLPLDGVIWFRKTIEVPENMAGKDCVLRLGRADEVDETFFNGTRIGGMTSWKKERLYPISGKLIKAGKATIAVKVTDNEGEGGLYGSSLGKMALTLAKGKGELDIEGEWKYQASDVKPHKRRLTNKAVKGISTSSIFNAMIAPLTTFSIRGIVWYQGESDLNLPLGYAELFRAVIRSWRKAWNSQEMPFYFVQLANYLKPVVDAGQHCTWPTLREAQLQALEETNTGMVVAIDLGDPSKSNSQNKAEVGRRLALWALADVYNKDVYQHSPMFVSFNEYDGLASIHFKNGKGLRVKNGGKPRGFAIAGSNGRFYWAESEFDGDNIILWNKKVRHPAAVRYAWSNNPGDCILVNKAGLPAAPFRTDDWEATEAPFWERSVRKFEKEDVKNPPGPGRTVFVGGPNLFNWKSIAKDLAPLKVLNRSFDEINTKDLSDLISRVITCYQPSAIVVSFDEDEIAQGARSKKFVKNCVRFIRKINKRMPEVPIVILALTPNPKLQDKRLIMYKVNRLLKELCDKNTKLFFLDVATPLLGEKEEPKPEFFDKNGLVINEKGYKLWAETIKPVLEKILKPSPK